MAIEDHPGSPGPAPISDEARWEAYQALMRKRSAAAEAAEPVAEIPAVPERVVEPLALQPTIPVRRRGIPRNLLAGGGLALAAGTALAVALLPGALIAPAPRQEIGPGLRVSRTATPPTGVTAQQVLPCFVAGTPAGALPLSECAARNGVASGRLDVGPAITAELPVARSPVAPPPPATAVSPSLPAMRPPPAALARAGRPPRPQRYEYAAAASEDERSLDPPPPVAAPPTDSVLAAREFYAALGEGDGDRAAAVVVPEKRRDGPLSARALSRFYSSLRSPLRVTGLYPLDDNTVYVRYQFVARGGGVCSGAARVATIERDGEALVRGIRASNGC